MKFGTIRRSVITFALTLVASSAAAQTTFNQGAVFNIPEANQGIAVDKFFFYAINNQTIAKYTKAGKFVSKWEGPAAGPIIHLDSGAERRLSLQAVSRSSGCRVQAHARITATRR